MNEVLTRNGPVASGKGILKNLAWYTASFLSLNGLFTWGLEDHWLILEDRLLPLDGLGTAFEGARVAHLSDIHCSPIVLDEYIRDCIRTVNEAEVDFVAITGDFITTGTKDYARRAARVLSELRPREGVVAVLGNHDYGVFHPKGYGRIRGLSDYLAGQLAGVGFRVLRNGAVQFRRGADTLQFVGAEDYWTEHFNAAEAFEQAEHAPTVTLCHNPDATPELIRHGAEYILAGHTHGQITPDVKFLNALMPMEQKQFGSGYCPLGGGRHLYVNRGIGHARRVHRDTRPEITFFTLTNAAKLAANN